MKTKMVLANWKMNKTLEESVTLFNQVQSFLENEVELKGVEIVIMPMCLALQKMKEKSSESTVLSLGAQSIFYEQKGNYCGGISPLFLKEFCKYAMIGHSELKQYFGETNDIIHKKLKACVEVGMIPVLCLGESLEEYETNGTKQVIREQIESALNHVEFQELVLLYEPLWALGSGVFANEKDVQAVITYIQEILEEKYGESKRQRIQILYAGSVNVDNVDTYMAVEGVDGVALGTSSLSYENLTQIIKKINQ